MGKYQTVIEKALRGNCTILIRECEQGQKKNVDNGMGGLRVKRDPCVGGRRERTIGKEGGEM